MAHGGGHRHSGGHSLISGLVHGFVTVISVGTVLLIGVVLDFLENPVARLEQFSLPIMLSIVLAVVSLIKSRRRPKIGP